MPRFRNEQRDSFSPGRLGWLSRGSGLRGGLDRCVRIHSGCHFKACFHNARFHHCPRHEDRREQTYDGEQTRVASTLAAADRRPFIHLHDPHSLKSLEAHLMLLQSFIRALIRVNFFTISQAACSSSTRDMQLVAAVTTLIRDRALLGAFGGAAGFAIDRRA
jgi:hypothetical protein